jgi:hypothetical protein
MHWYRQIESSGEMVCRDAVLKKLWKKASIYLYLRGFSGS